MKIRIRTILAAIGALALVSTLSGCIFVGRGGHGGGRCDIPTPRTVCQAGHYGHGPGR